MIKVLKIIKKLFKDPVEESISEANKQIMDNEKALMDAIIERQNRMDEALKGYDEYFNELMKSFGIEEAN